MKKLIALFAVTMLATTSAIASIALSGVGSVTFNDGGTAASDYDYEATLTVVGTAGTTTVTGVYSMEGASLATDSLDMATKIGPLTIAADMHNEDSSDDACTTACTNSGDPIADIADS
ncbi:uncharacterized protein METZ01_LOCUS496869, partial [marine metagenome]